MQEKEENLDHLELLEWSVNLVLRDLVDPVDLLDLPVDLEQMVFPDLLDLVDPVDLLDLKVHQEYRVIQEQLETVELVDLLDLVVKLDLLEPMEKMDFQVRTYLMVSSISK